MSFSIQVKKFSDKALQNALKTRRAIIIKLFSSVVTSTPVDTGRARGNWTITKDQPSKALLDRLDKSGGIVISQILSTADGKDGILFLINNLPYIKRLEYDGWSQQAPEGMVRINIARIRRYVSETVKEVSS